MIQYAIIFKSKKKGRCDLMSLFSRAPPKEEKTLINEGPENISLTSRKPFDLKEKNDV